MKKLILLSLFLLPSFVFAQNPDSLRPKHLPDSLRHWHRGGNVSLNFTQSSYTDWAAGGENSIAGQALLNLHLNYRMDSTTSWENNLELGYGMQQLGIHGLLKKTDDKIDFTSQYNRYAFDRVWYYSAMLNFKTQFSPGYTYLDDTAKTLISDFMAPAYTILALGLDYKPNKHFSVLIAPLTGKITFVMNQQLADAGAFGVDSATHDTLGNKLTNGSNVRYEFGGYIRAQYKADIMPNVNLMARCELFSNYLDRPQNIDVNAEIMLNLKVNKFISASLNMQGIYDNDIQVAFDSNHDNIIDGKGPRFQFREVLGVGLSTKF